MEPDGTARQRPTGPPSTRRASSAVALAGALLLAMLALSPTSLWAQATTATQREAQEITRTLKCPVCQSQSVADSPSQLAQEMRTYVERRLEAGESRDAIVQDLVDRYGEGILLEPPRRGFTLIVWWLPILSLALGGVIVALTLRRATRPAASPGGGAPAEMLLGGSNGLPSAGREALPELAPEEVAHYRARLADELASRERGPA